MAKPLLGKTGNLKPPLQSYAPWALLVGILAFAILYLGPNDGHLTTDSMEYLARRYAGPLHPHHLIWVYVLWAGHLGVRVFLGLQDVIESSRLFQAGASAWAISALYLILSFKGGLPKRVSAVWALLLAAAAGFQAIAYEKEGYNFAIAMYLTALLAAPTAELTFRQLLKDTRFWLSVIAFSLAVCVHQMFCLAALPILLYYYRPFKKSIQSAGILIPLLSGAICLTAYLIAYRVIPDRTGFIGWLSLYSGQMPVFGKGEHITTPYFIHRLIANLLAATIADPVIAFRKTGTELSSVPLLLKLSMAAGYGLWMITGVSALVGLWSRRALYRVFASWFLLFEGFLWYWAPWLLQMQVLVLPAMVGVLAFGADELLHKRLRYRQFVTLVVLVPLLAAILIVTKVVQPPKLGYLTLDEAKDFYDKNGFFASEKPAMMILYGYGASRPYMIVPGSKTATMIAVVENGDPVWLRQKRLHEATQKAAATINDGGAALIHKSMLLEDEGECGVLDLAQRLAELAETKSVQVELLRTSDGLPVAIQLRKTVDSSSLNWSVDLPAASHELTSEAALTTAPVPCSRPSQEPSIK